MDLKLIAGDFLTSKVPKAQQYLLKYFHTDSQQQFLVYYLQFADLKNRSAKHLYQNFVDHTGDAEVGQEAV